MKQCNKNLLKVLDSVHKLICIADIGDLQRDDVGCGEVYSLIRDEAYKLKTLTESEIKKHKHFKKWNGD